MFLDEVAFQNQRFSFRLCGQESDVPHLAQENPRAWMQRKGALEIGAHSCLQGFGFADVKDIGLAILHEIDAMQFRNFRQNF